MRHPDLTAADSREGARWQTLVSSRMDARRAPLTFPRGSGHRFLQAPDSLLWMPTQGWNQTLVTQRTAGTLFNTYTTAKTIINQQDLFGFYANYFQVGSKLRIRAQIATSTLITTPGTLTLQVMLGSIVVFTTGAMQLNATAHTLLPLWVEIELTCQKTNTAVGGAVAQFMGQAKCSGVMLTSTAAQVDGVNTMTTLLAPATAPALGTAFDSTISQILDFWAGFSISNAANGVQIAQYEVEALNMPAS